MIFEAQPSRLVRQRQRLREAAALVELYVHRVVQALQARQSVGDIKACSQNSRHPYPGFAIWPDLHPATLRLNTDRYSFIADSGTS
jgi:hypothetical protein